MTVTIRATIDLPTSAARDAFKAALPLVQKLKTDDYAAERRIRLVFGDAAVPSVDDGDKAPQPGWLFVLASNGEATGVAKARIVEDSRDLALPHDDGPMIVDLAPDWVRIILQTFKDKPKEGANQVMRLTLTADTLTVADVGGMLADGAKLAIPVSEPDERFPDALGIVGQAHQRVQGKSQPAKPLITDAGVLKAFKAAGDVYGPLRLRGTGSADTGGWTVQAGAHFIGTLSTRPHDDDSLKRNDRIDRDWLGLLPSRLAAVREA